MVNDENQAEQDARAYALSIDPGERIRPRDLQAVSKGAVSFNAACRVLERLQVDGELVRLASSEGLVWRRAQPASTTSRAYALPLTQREHGALLRLLDRDLERSASSARIMDGVAAQQQLDEQTTAKLQALKADLPTLRAIRLRLKRPA